MRRFLCICFVSLLLLGLCGCQNEDPAPRETLPPWSTGAFETVLVDDFNYVYGEIVGKISPNGLALEPDEPRMIEAWGELVYIITDEADAWDVGDEIEVWFTVVQRPSDTTQPVQILADEVHRLALAYKPILYFYPEVATECSAKVVLNGELTCTYPEHGVDGWGDFIAYPDGTLVFPDGKEYYALYWEGVQAADWDFSRGWCVRGEDTAAFLEWALAEQGLTRREANEFIIYWLPLMQDAPYNVISFQTTAYTDTAVLEITPTPDSLLRVFMAYHPSEVAVSIEPQDLERGVREGFTVVEWGGSRVSAP